MSASPSLLLIIRNGPFGRLELAEALDIALVTASFGGQVALYFCDDGVMALAQHQLREAQGQKGTLATLRALPMYDIEALYADADSLKARGLEQSDLALDVKMATLDQLVSQYQQTFVF